MWPGRGRGLTNQTWPHAVSHAGFKRPHLLWETIFNPPTHPLLLRSRRRGIQGVSVHSASDSCNNKSCTTECHKRVWLHIHERTQTYCRLTVKSSLGGQTPAQWAPYSPPLGGFNLSASAVFTHIKLQRMRSNTRLWSHTQSCVDQSSTAGLNWVILVSTETEASSRPCRFTLDGIYKNISLQQLGLFLLLYNMFFIVNKVVY